MNGTGWLGVLRNESKYLSASSVFVEVCDWFIKLVQCDQANQSKYVALTLTIPVFKMKKAIGVIVLIKEGNKFNTINNLPETLDSSTAPANKEK